MDNQQQLAIQAAQLQRPTGELLVLGLGAAVIGLGVAWALKELFPESMPS